jgi:hypothetical protein
MFYQRVCSSTADRRGHTLCSVVDRLLARPERTPLGARGALEEATWAGATKSTPTIARRRVVSPLAGSGEIAATVSEIDGSSAIAAAWSLLELDRGDIAEGAVQPAVVKPRDPFDGRELQLRL